MTKTYVVGTEPAKQDRVEPDRSDQRSVSGTTHARKTTKTDARARIDALRESLRSDE